MSALLAPTQTVRDSWGGFDARLLVRQHADMLSWPGWEALRAEGAGN